MSAESETKSSVAKDAPKRKKSVAAAKTKQKPSDASESQVFVPSEVPAGSTESKILQSPDDPEPESKDKSPDAESPAQSKDENSDQSNSKPEKSAAPRNPRHERSGRNSKFKGKPGTSPNSTKRGRGRWQDKKKQAQKDDVTLELADLVEFELFQDFEGLIQLADDLCSGKGDPLDFNQIYEMALPQLREEAAAAKVETPNAPSREQLVNALVAQANEDKRGISVTGVFEVLDDDAGGLLVYERDNYRIKAVSAYVPQLFVERYGLQRGHIIDAQLHPHRENESCPFVVRIHKVMDRDPELLGEIVPFTEGVPYYPLKRILMESDPDSHSNNLSMRVVDCLTPVGFGQRGLIVAPPRTGKTVLMQGIANSIQKNYPEAHLIILLIDERPEEVTDFRRQVSGEVISSTFDESAESHVHAAEMVIEKARRMVETGKDVVILLDSITRLARAYNTTMPNSGKILSGGVEANALQKPKRFFGSARNIEDGGSLTIIATALVETGSKMDEVIFEEFKGTGNMELHLDRGLSDKRIFPALSMDKSGTRKEELLYHPDEMQKIYSLRRAMKGVPSTDAMEMLIQRIKKTQTNAEFLMSVSR
jgi:transcription termination factor Rho